MENDSKIIKNFDYYYDLLSSKLIDRKYFYWLTRQPIDREGEFYDEETFLLNILNLCAEASGGRLEWLIAVGVNSGQYEFMNVYQFLKDKDKLGVINEMANKLRELVSRTYLALMLKNKYDKAVLIDLFNENVHTLTELSEKIDDVMRGIEGPKTKDKNKAGGYIG